MCGIQYLIITTYIFKDITDWLINNMLEEVVIHLDALIKTITFLSFIWLCAKGICEIFLLNPFDNIFEPKAKLKMYAKLKVIIASFVLIIIITVLSFYLRFILGADPNIIKLILNLVGYIFLFSLLLLMANAIYLKIVKKDPKFWLTESPKYIAVTYLLSLVIFWGLNLCVIFEQAKTSGHDNAIYVFSLSIVIIWVFILSFISLMAMLYKKPETANYIINLKGKDLFVIGAKDKDKLILSSKRMYKKDAFIYLYDINSNTLVEFIPTSLKQVRE